MSVFVLEKELAFPPVQFAEPDGLLAIGGDLSAERLLLAYRSGIFPWYEGEHILWWSPDPRFVLFPDELVINNTVKKLITSETMRFTVNMAFPDVIRNCKTVRRPGQHGTWITDEVEKAYTRLHELGYAHSAEVWKDEQLIGGLYGVRLGKLFFGESMFSLHSNASRVAFTKYVGVLKKEDVELIDCQVYTSYLESLGAKMIPREVYIQKLKQMVP